MAVDPDLGKAPLVVVVGATASGKSALAVRLAEEFGGEIVSCDSVAVYREMEIGTAKPSLADRARVRHHMIDVVWPDEPYTAGEYSRAAREAIAEIGGRGRLPIVAGGTGLYLRALLEGLFPAPPTMPGVRERLRAVAGRSGGAIGGPERLHRILRRLDPMAAQLIHANDVSKVVRAIEVSCAARQPMTALWAGGRDALTGFRVLRLGLQPPRDELYGRIDRRAEEMFERGLVEETGGLVRKYGVGCRALGSLGYAQAGAMLRGEVTRDEAVRAAQQGHRNYAKRQGTWFRREKDVVWLKGFGDDAAVIKQAMGVVRAHADGSMADVR